MHVIVVGAGPCGFSLSLVLARAGIRVTLLDKADGVGSQPRAAHIFAPGIQLLRRAGALGDVRRAGFVPNNATFRKADGTPIVTIEDFAPSKSPDATTVLPIDTLGKILSSHAQKNDNISLIWGCQVLDVGQDKDSAWVSVRENGGTEKVMKADFVCGCDGATSQVRKSLFGGDFRGKTWDDQMVATNIYYPCDKWGYDDLNFFIDPKDWHIVARLTKDGLWRVSYREDGSKTLRQILDDHPARFERLLPGHPKPEDYTVLNISPYRLHQRSAEKYRVGRICLAADAAHLCNPWGGLGLTGGFADAIGLSECLIGIHMDRADQRILEKYDEVRRSIYRNFTDPVSTTNFMRVSTSDPDTILEKDPVLATVARMEGDSKTRDDFDRHIYGILHDFTQYYTVGMGKASL
ncbi:para-nitrophenol 4-monooxygenase [Penicillium cosmopolitanum]|uniref:Para-nitrophenol 4-monooxygenase n=1 Tax=Penicillium cosmopolitanum TaxID=1131564 RepID=A0A9W9VH93_9EURO|nr:para-nitrophenol 4-monooxygenase [Penicillium cosmopolitanum]KAJ5379346.1 para-nitrophenol 4-monooxygenase [Penicillium cosmopolitanum]